MKNHRFYFIYASILILLVGIFSACTDTGNGIYDDPLYVGNACDDMEQTSVVDSQSLVGSIDTFYLVTITDLMEVPEECAMEYEDEYGNIPFALDDFNTCPILTDTMQLFGNGVYNVLKFEFRNEHKTEPNIFLGERYEGVIVVDDPTAYVYANSNNVMILSTTPGAEDVTITFAVEPGITAFQGGFMGLNIAVDVIEQDINVLEHSLNYVEPTSGINTEVCAESFAEECDCNPYYTETAVGDFTEYNLLSLGDPGCIDECEGEVGLPLSATDFMTCPMSEFCGGTFLKFDPRGVVDTFTYVVGTIDLVVETTEEVEYYDYDTGDITLGTSFTVTIPVNSPDMIMVKFKDYDTDGEAKEVFFATVSATFTSLNGDVVEVLCE